MTEHPRRDHHRRLVDRFEELIGRAPLKRALPALIPDFPSGRRWQTRDYAIAVHRLEHFADRGRAPAALFSATPPAPSASEQEAEMPALLDQDARLLEQRIAIAETGTEGLLVNGRPAWFWELAVATNAAFKGLLGSMNQSGHICARTLPIVGRLDAAAGIEPLTAQILDRIAPLLREGDVVVLAEKLFAVAEGRIGPRAVLHEPDPKTVPPAELPALAKHWQEKLGFPIAPIHLLLADEYEADRATLGVSDHNRTVARVAAAIRDRLRVKVDVVISDTDTGIDTRSPLINTLTLCASPIGATAGLTLYEAMRCACAAEFVRGHDRMIGIVLCRPAARRAGRPHMGEARAYDGVLDATREPGLSHA